MSPSYGCPRNESKVYVLCGSKGPLVNTQPGRGMMLLLRSASDLTDDDNKKTGSSSASQDDATELYQKEQKMQDNRQCLPF